jgi:hypothetical protein
LYDVLAFLALVLVLIPIAYMQLQSFLH